jgi:pSer/pThr/pTyr-binding forkhead associated (FHA) protein
MNRTQIFEPSSTNPGASAASEALKHAIYPLVKGEYSTTSSRSFTIGRIDGNDMIMPDFAISKKHAVITVDNGSFYIKDLGSTNGTMVNGTRLDKKSVKIHDQDVVSFARYEFTFLLPSSLYKMLNA